MICNKCSKIVALSAFSEGKCKICEKPTPTPHIPSYSVCNECSEKNNICEQCGKKIK